MVRDRDRMFREQVTKKTELGWKKVSEKRKEKRKRKPVSRTKQHSSTAQQQERKANRLESRKISADPRLPPTTELKTTELGDLVTVHNEAVRPILVLLCVVSAVCDLCIWSSSDRFPPHGAECAAIV